MRFLKQISIALLFTLSFRAAAADTNGFLRQILTLPATATYARFADVNGDGKLDLLVADPVAGQLHIHRQRPTGFDEKPDQTVPLPPQTAWITVCDVDPHPGVELVVSTGNGFIFHRQNNGVFETESHTLISDAQVFTNTISPAIFPLTNGATLPLITATAVVPYQRADGIQWTRGVPMPLRDTKTSWVANRYQWSFGEKFARSLRVEHSFRNTPDERDIKPENDGIKKLIEDLKKASTQYPVRSARMDIDGDGRQDLVVSQVANEFDLQCRSDIFIFLRGADGKLPERPSQVMHCRGFPIPVGDLLKFPPVVDLRGDGSHQILLVELNDTLTSASGFVDLLVSKGFDWLITVRKFKNGRFSRTPDATYPFKAIFSLEKLKVWPLFICGDYNGDGRLDLVAQRSTTQWNIFCGTSDDHMFDSHPTMTFETPAAGWLDIQDLNGDGRSDIVLLPEDDPRIVIYLSQPMRTKGGKP